MCNCKEFLGKIYVKGNSMRNYILLVFCIALLAFSQLNAQVTTAQSGSWQTASTWSTGTVPDSTTDVKISSGNIISIDDGTAYCKSISFADTSAHLLMATATSNFKVYGDFTVDTTHKAFSSWTAGAKIIFAGTAAKQTIGGWKTVSGTTTVFLEMVVDKDSGVVATPRKNNRFAFGTSLEIKKGTFLLDSLDDMESKTLGGTGQTGTITIQSGGIFQMGGGTSYIRRGTFLLSSDSLNPRIGKLTVYGKAVLTSSSANGMNFGGIEIMDGGQVTLATGGSAGYFNSGIITVHSGGVLQNNTTTSVYHATAAVVLEAGAEFNSVSSTTPLPAGRFDYSLGTVRFSRSNDQTIPAVLTQFTNLYLSGSGIKTLGANITVNGTLSFRGSASLNLGGFAVTYGSNAILQYGAPGQSTAQTTADAEFPETNGPNNLSIYNTGGVTLHANRTIPGTLTLSSGIFDNNGSADDKVLTMAAGSTIRRASGSLSAAPAFSSTVNLSYISTVASVTTDLEVPADPSVLNNLSISSTKGVSLGADVALNGTLTFETGAAALNTNTHTLKLAGSTSFVAGETSSAYVEGILTATRTVGLSSSDFGGIGFAISSGSNDIGDVTVTRTAGATGVLTVDGKQSIARNWSVSAASQPASGRTISLSWPSADDNGITFGGTTWAKVMQLNSGTWTPNGIASLSADDPHVVSVPVTSLSTFTVVDTAGVTGINDQIGGKAAGFALHQNYPNPFNPSTMIKFELDKEQFVSLSVYNTAGEEIAVLAHQQMQAGVHQVMFNASNLPSGLYLAKLRAGTHNNIIKMLLVK
jgi:hypothetical protein